MNTPEDVHHSSSSSRSEDFSLFQEAVQRATALAVPLNFEERFKNAAAVSHSTYRYVTQSALDSSSPETSQSTAASNLETSETTDSKERSRSNHLESLGTSWSEDGSVSPITSKFCSTGCGESTVHPFRKVSRRRGTRITVGKADDSSAQPTTREVWGGLLSEVGMSGYKALLWVFFPLLIFSLYAASKPFLGGTSSAADTVHCSYGVKDRDPRCLKVCDSFTKDLTGWTSGGNNTGSAGVTILEILSAGYLQPADLIAGMLGASVVLQVVVFTITGPLLDYGRYQRYLLWLGAGIGVGASAIPINVFRPDWWWIGGILLLFSTIGLGLATTWLDSYLSSLARGIPILKAHLFDEVQIFQSVRTRFVHKGSLAGVGFGAFSAVLCTLAAFFFLRSRLVPKLMGPDPNNWSLRIACCVGGIWWLFWTLTCSAFLLKDRPGPSLQSIPHPAAKHLPMAILGMRIGPGKGRSALLLLLVCFLSSMGNATVFQSGLLCFSPTRFIQLVLLSQLSSFAGTILFSAIQIVLSWSSKVMLLIALLLHLLLPIYACVGFFFTTSRRKSKLLGLNREWEFMVFAGAYGVCLGVHRSYIRTLFLACIPGPTSVGAYISFLTLVNQFSTFVGSLEVLLFVHYNGDLRYTFAIMGVALLLASIVMVTYISTSMQDDVDVVTDAADISLHHDASFFKSSVYYSTSKSTSVSSVYIPMSLRTQFTNEIQQSGRIDSGSVGTHD